MTVINHKSISGITSITAPAGSDNLLTVHTNDTTERFRIVDSGAIVTGVTTASNFKTGTTNVHNVGVELAGINVLGADTPIGTGATIYNSGAAVFTGIVTATNLNVESKVGIGTASPDFIQHNYHATDNVLALFESGDEAALISFQDNNSTDNTQVWLGAQTNDLRLAAGGNERLRIKSDGKIGINTTSPTYGGHLHGTGASNNAYYMAEQSSAGASAGFRLKTTGSHFAMYGATSGSALGIYDYNAGAERFTIDSSGYIKLSGRNVQGSANGDKLLRIYQPSRTDAEEDVLLLQSYNQSGTSSITIGGGDSSFNAATDISFRTAAVNTTSGIERLRIDSSGNMALGTITPNNYNNYTTFTINGTTGGQIDVESNGTKFGDIYTQSNTFHIRNKQASGNGSLVFHTTSGGTCAEKLRIDNGGNVYFSGSQTGNNRGIIYNSTNGFGIYASANSSTDRNIKFYSNSQSSSQKFAILANGALQHTPTGGPSTFNSGSEYVFGSNLSSPSSGGAEANFQIHAAKTRAQFSVNAYMNNAGGPFMQFISSRSGTLGTLGTKCQNNDYLGEIRFLGDNGTNSTTLCQGASIYAQAASTPADGDTTIAGELYFVTGTASGGSQPVRLCIDSAGRLTMNESNVAANAKALRIKADNDTTSTASTDRTGSNSYKNSAIVIQKGISNGGLVAGLIDAWDGAIHGTSIGITYTSGRYHTSFGVNNDTNDRPIEIMTISGNKKVKIGGGLANIPADIGLEIGGDGATTEIRLKNSGSGTGASDGFAIQKWSNGNNYIYDYDGNNILFGTSNGSRTQMDTSGRWTFAPSGGSALTSGSTTIAMSIINNGGSANSGSAYPGIAFKSTGTGGGNGMAIVNFDGNWDLYTRSGNQQGLAILHSNSSSSGNARLVVGDDGKCCLGTEVYDNLSTSRDSYTALHIAGGALSIGPKGNNSATRQGGRYVLGWYMMSAYTGHSYIHVVTDVWGGGSSGGGNNDYIMGGFHIHGHAYQSNNGQSEERIYFHNWGGSMHGYSRGHWGAWNPGNAVYINSSGYVTIRLLAGNYRGYIIDLVQHAWYSIRNINVTAHTGSDSSTI